MQGKDISRATGDASIVLYFRHVLAIVQQCSVAFRYLILNFVLFYLAFTGGISTNVSVGKLKS